MGQQQSMYTKKITTPVSCIYDYNKYKLKKPIVYVVLHVYIVHSLSTEKERQKNLLTIICSYL